MRNEERQNAAEALHELRQGVESMRLCLEQQIEGMIMIAKLQKAHYDVLIESGFTDQQAMQIICTKGFSQ